MPGKNAIRTARTRIMQTLTLLHSRSFPLGRYAEGWTREAIASSSLISLDDLPAGDASSLRVLLVDRTMANGRQTILPLDARTAVVGVGLEEPPHWLTGDRRLPAPAGKSVRARAARRGETRLPVSPSEATRRSPRESAHRPHARAAGRRPGRRLPLHRARSLRAADHDPEQGARDVARDAGSLYLLDEQDGSKVLRWKLAQNDSIDVEGFEEKILPITRKSLAGYVAMTGETLVIDDAYDLPADAEYQINRTFDEQNGYLTRSLLVFPMTNHDPAK